MDKPITVYPDVGMAKLFQIISITKNVMILILLILMDVVRLVNGSVSQQRYVLHVQVVNIVMLVLNTIN